jgi:hypothetical protein
VGGIADGPALALPRGADRLLCLLVVGRLEEGDAGLGVEVVRRHPHRGTLAEPRRDVARVVELVRCGLPHELRDLGLGIVGAQHLARRFERLLALIALRPDDRLGVEQRVGRDQGCGVAVAARAAAAAARNEENRG